jgi:peptidoglycan/xylan/chitin deacetylase (PgdA/CDA1 family)
MRIIKLLLLWIFLFAFSLTSCAEAQIGNPNGIGGSNPSSNSESAPGLTQTTSLFERTNTKIATSVATSTFTVVPPTVTKTPSPTPTPYSLVSFSSSQLRTGIMPVSYIEDVCTYLENRWGEEKSEPGTIVVPIMFHSVAKPGRQITDNTTITMEQFEYFMTEAKEMGFSTITTEDLIGFLNDNDWIPQRSLLLIQDDRSPGVTELFMPYLEEYDWTLTLAWPTTDLTSEAIWDRMEALAESGRLDIQSHGHDHIYIQDYTPLEEIEEEIYKPIEVIQEHFGTTPEALIWPGGNFTKESIKIAVEAGFKVGFSVYSNGPILYNWIPLREEQIEMDSPLMILPRYWSPDNVVALEHALKISQEAVEFAESVKEQELAYYATYCQSSKGE